MVGSWQRTKPLATLKSIKNKYLEDSDNATLGVDTNTDKAPIAESPEEYVLICKKLGFDSEYRLSLKREILTKADKYLFYSVIMYKFF